MDAVFNALDHTILVEFFTEYLHVRGFQKLGIDSKAHYIYPMHLTWANALILIKLIILLWQHGGCAFNHKNCVHPSLSHTLHVNGMQATGIPHRTQVHSSQWSPLHPDDKINECAIVTVPPNTSS